MANKRSLSCGKEVFAIGQEGSIKDLENKLSLCFNCENSVSCKGFIHYSKSLVASLEILL
jgi:hypothetical protein